MTLFPKQLRDNNEPKNISFGNKVLIVTCVVVMLFTVSFLSGYYLGHESVKPEIKVVYKDRVVTVQQPAEYCINRTVEVPIDISIVHNPERTITTEEDWDRQKALDRANLLIETR